MPHNQKSIARGLCHNTITFGTKCGIDMKFHTYKQKELWVKIHRKNCKECSTKDNFGSDYNVNIHLKPK
jgi:hypothetical protein